MLNPIFCFICNCQVDYCESTIKAIASLRKHTKKGKVGIIFPPGSGKSLLENREFVEQKLKEIDPKFDTYSIIYREGQTHLDNWNPAQHKLDIQLFATQFDPVVWLDSDTIVLKNIYSYVDNFLKSGKTLGFFEDSMNSDPNFKKHWEGPRPIFIPQSNFMIFRSVAIRGLFKNWRDIWSEWVTPYPFALHTDPAPYYKPSIFAIEQYALGQAVFKYAENKFDRLVSCMDRRQVYIARDLSGRTQRLRRELLLAFPHPEAITLPDFDEQPQCRFRPVDAEELEAAAQWAEAAAAKAGGGKEGAAAKTRAFGNPFDGASGGDSDEERRISEGGQIYSRPSSRPSSRPGSSAFASPFEQQEEEDERNGLSGINIPKVSNSANANANASGGRPLKTYPSDYSIPCGSFSPALNAGFHDEVPGGAATGAYGGYPRNVPLSPVSIGSIGRCGISPTAPQSRRARRGGGGGGADTDDDLDLAGIAIPINGRGGVPGGAMARDLSQQSCMSNMALSNCSSTPSMMGMNACASQELF